MIVTSWKVKGIFKADAQKVSEEIAGFGLGIGSGRTSGYGRYKVTDVKAG